MGTLFRLFGLFGFIWLAWRGAIRARRWLAHSAQTIRRFNELIEKSAFAVCSHENMVYGVTVEPGHDVMDVCADCGHGWCYDGTEHEGIVMDS